MSSDSATAVASQQSINARIATLIAAGADPTYSGGESHTFDGGLIIKGGFVAHTSQGSKTLTFATPFPNAILTFVISAVDDRGVAESMNTTVKSYTVNGAVVYVAVSLDGFTWIAIGY